MVVIELRFPTGRFHATPWGRQVNEGAVEWPPAPWRLLRAILATWHHKGQDLLTSEEIRHVLAALIPLPKFLLPPATQAHTRHYMPTRGNTTKVFDTFIHLGDQPICIVWPEAELPPAQHQALGLLLDRMTYFGRAESWVEARLVEEWDGEFNAWPIHGDEAPVLEGERIRLLASQSQGDYAIWYEEALSLQGARRLAELQASARVKGKPVEAVKLTPKDHGAIAQGLPADIFAALHADTGELRKAGWSQPPGSRWVSYIRPADSFAVRPERKALPTITSPSIARFAVSGAVLPRLTDAVSVGERVRVALMSRSKDDRGNADPVFSGKTDQGQRLEGGHQHVHIFSEANGSRDGITHLTLYAPMGFEESARRALGRLEKIWGHGGHDLKLVLLGLGNPIDFGGLDTAQGQCPLVAASQVWVSRTPFVLTRHPKTTRDGRPKLREDGWQIDGPEAQLVAELARRGFPTPCAIARIPHTRVAGRELRWLKFRRERQHGAGSRSDLAGYGFRIEFAQPVAGPIALGYGCHFGLGLFTPDFTAV